MAHPVVAGVTEGGLTAAGTSVPVTLPAGGASTDEYIVIMDIGSTSATLNALTDWTELLDEAAANGLKIVRYTGAGVPSDPTFVTSASTRTVWIAYRITGADKTVTPQIGTTSTGTSATPDPPASATPPSSKDYLFIAFAGMAGEEADDDTWGNTPPTNYTPSPPRQKSGGVGGTNIGGLILSAERQLTTGVAENPGTFGVDVSAAWRAQTITVHPQAASPITVNGGVASEANSGPVGKVQQVYTAAPASETDTGPSGKVLQRYTAAPAAESDTAPAGTVIQAQVVAGGVAASSESVPAGRAQQIYTASPAGESDTAPAGKVLQVYTAAPALEADSVPSGSILAADPQTIVGGVASEGDAVPAGHVAQIYLAGVASEADAALAGAVLQTIFGGVAGESNSAPAGVVLVGGQGQNAYGLIEGAGICVVHYSESADGATLTEANGTAALTEASPRALTGVREGRGGVKTTETVPRVTVIGG